MGDRVPIVPIPGLVPPFVDVDLPVATLAKGGTLSRVFLSTLEAPGVGGVVASIRTATGGGGSGIQATIAEGALSGVGSGAIDVADGGTLYLRISAAAVGSGWLSGWFEFEEGAYVAATALTTLALVKQHAGISDSDNDALLSNLILAVSDAMQRKMRRAIVSRDITDERHDSIGSHRFALAEYPIVESTTVTVRENDVELTSSDFLADRAAGLLVRISGGYPIAWAQGLNTIGVDYTAGFTSIPGDLILAATKQVRHEFSQASPSGQDRLGKRNLNLPTGGGQEYEPDGWLPSVIEVMRCHTRKF